MSIDSRTELPPGYTWQECPEIRASFPKPDGWFYKHERARGTLAYFITREPIGNVPNMTVAYKTGLSVNVFPNFTDRIRRSPSQFAKYYMRSQKELIPDGRPTTTQDGDLVTCRGHFRYLGGLIMGKKAGRFNTYIEVTGNDRTHTAYMISFESSPELWEQDREIGQIIIDNRILDNNF